MEKIDFNNDPLENIEWHISLDGRISNASTRGANHTSDLIKGLKALKTISDPIRANNLLDFLVSQREKAIPKQTKIYYHNRIKQIFMDADSLIYNMTYDDEMHYNLTREDIKEYLTKKMVEYDIKEYRFRILYPETFRKDGTRKEWI
jgi:hypothetical protein